MPPEAVTSTASIPPLAWVLMPLFLVAAILAGRALIDWLDRHR